MFTCQFLLTANVMLTYECVLTRASPVDKCLFLYTGSVAYVQVTFSCQHHVVTLKRCMSCQFVMLTALCGDKLGLGVLLGGRCLALSPLKVCLMKARKLR